MESIKHPRSRLKCLRLEYTRSKCKKYETYETSQYNIPRLNKDPNSETNT